ncbi:efflux RND transporter periplasmic adaptor subunit [Verrucomicrobiota bacterium sgz303538]
MWKRMLLMLLLVALVIGALGFIKYRQIQAAIAMGALMAPPPAAVTTVVIKPQTWQPVLSAVGSLKAVNGVTVSTDLAGIVSEIPLESGTRVKKGDLLVQLDTQQEDAQLRSAQARLELAKIDMERKRDLVAKKAVAASDLDAAQSEFRQAEAAVEEVKAVVGRKRIAAPFDGILGIRQVNVGQYLNPGAPIIPLQSLDPIYVEFALPQQHLETIAPGKKLRLTASGLTGQEFSGEITAIDSRVDEASRNIMVQGTIPNPDHKLRPGMFVGVEVLLPEQEGVLAVPSSAINYAPYGDSVYVVKEEAGPDGKPTKMVQQQIVRLGTTRGDLVTLLSGVKAGDEVVSSGTFKLRPGAPVQVNNVVQPGESPTPQPPNS